MSIQTAVEPATSRTVVWCSITEATGRWRHTEPNDITISLGRLKEALHYLLLLLFNLAVPNLQSILNIP